jgi:hypothetical protein
MPYTRDGLEEKKKYVCGHKICQANMNKLGCADTSERFATFYCHGCARIGMLPPPGKTGRTTDTSLCQFAQVTRAFSLVAVSHIRQRHIIAMRRDGQAGVVCDVRASLFQQSSAFCTFTHKS